MVANTPTPGKKYYTVAQANAALPLVRAIVQDVCDLTRSVIAHSDKPRAAESDEDPEEEAFVRASAERMRELVRELSQLDIELKDHAIGLIDFPCWIGDREVYLCWRLGEPEVAYWHELDSGFAGRRRVSGIEQRIFNPEARAKLPER